MSKLKRFYFDKEENEDLVVLKGQECVHCKNVMRLRKGDELIACCGDGFDYICKINEIKKDEIQCTVLEKKKNEQDATLNLVLYQANLKADKVELIVQKTSEIGVNELVLFDSDYCVAKNENSNKLGRFKKIAIESAKQCGRSSVIKLGKFIDFRELLVELSAFDMVVFAYENQKTTKITELEGQFENIAVIIGSEGGFSPSECEQLLQLSNVRCVTLGKRILRAETASIVASALVMNCFEK